MKKEPNLTLCVRLRPVRRCALLLSLVLAAALLTSFLPVGGEERIYSDVIRLHILASSDSECDQADKLAVRDAILAAYSDELSAFSSRDEAEAWLTEEKRAEVAALAEATLSSRGAEPTVSVTLSLETYPRRDYESFTLPAGTYLSLRVVIGAGEGHNWWCVLFPPLCTAAATEGVPLGLSESEYRLLSGNRVTLRFRTLELLARLSDSVGGRK